MNPEILSNIWMVIKTLYAITIVAAVYIVIRQNRNPINTVTWILVLLTLPGIGLGIYIFFGQRIRQEKRITRQLNKVKLLINNHFDPQKAKTAELYKETISLHKNTIEMLAKNTPAVLTTNNAVKLLVDGTTTFDTIIEAIENAKTFVHIEYYIFELDKIGNRIVDALQKRVADGVEIKMLLDDVGCWRLSQSDIDKIKSMGIEIEMFMPVRFPKFTSKVNYRNHRKIVVVDGKIGFLGGINVADRYIDGGKEHRSWHDMHLKIVGESVNLLETIFTNDWFYATEIEITEKKYFPEPQKCGNIPLQIATSGPYSKWPAIMMGIFSVIATARKYVYISTPYFMPTETVLTAIKAAALGGVDVRIILPEKSDSWLTHKCSRSYIKELLLANVKVYFYNKGFIHSKTIACDDSIAIVGSANMDFRSFEQNFEISAFIYDKSIAQELCTIFVHDIEHSTEVQLKQWNRRSRWRKVCESFARLLSPVL